MISFVVQGPYHQGLHQCLESIRRYYPDAEIVLSSYKGNSCWLPQREMYDILVQSDDPGPLEHPIHQANISVNRQIVTSNAGCKAATRPYICKLRNDLTITKTILEPSMVHFYEKRSSCQVFESKIWTSHVYSLNPYGALKFLFHPGDWVYFGNKEDVSQLFDIPLLRTEDVVKDNKLFRRNEQYMFLETLKKFGHDIDLKYDEDSSIDKDLSLRYLISNFAIISLEDLGFRSQKYGPVQNQANTYIDSTNYHIFQKAFDR